MQVVCMLLFTRCGDFITNTTEGPVSGFQMKSRNGRNFIGYSGIPYAKPPIEELRFQDPQPPSKWHKVREPSFIGELCLQSLHNVKMLRNAVIGSEDCLYMSVYTPQLNPLKLYPVLVYIHGGGYEYGAGEFLGRPGYFLDHDIVLVTFNYRLGILGFLSMEDSTLPGNMGLKDQNMVLQWVQKNIRNFGGDPNMVTIYGESAGAGSVHHHMLSPLSKGLFHQAISQSGTALSAKNFLPPGIAKTRAMKLAEKAGCPSSNTEQMLICLREMNAQDITRLNQIFSMKQIESLAPFIPVVDSVAANPFLPKETDQLVPEPVPWMIGCSNMEGLVQTAYLSKNPYYYNDLDANFTELIPKILYQDQTKINDDTAGKIRTFYFGNEPITPIKAVEVTNIVTDSSYIWPMLKSLKHHSGPHYVYYDTYLGKHSLQDIYGIYRIANGTAHVDESIYLWDLSLTLRLYGPDLEFSKLLVQLWVNFVTYGTPTPSGFKFDWPQWDDSNQKYLKFSNEGTSVGEKLLPERMQFWSTIV